MLTRAEELILLAVWRLKERAYSVEIRADLKAVTGRPWSFGAVYMPLDRLAKRGLLESYLADPTSERGGRSKRIYSLTAIGLAALREIRRIQDTAWEGLPSRITEDV
ncbi:MAG: helix-turn-helix transcriptional regulator [Candidatus Aminicenantaceae bacterium]|jgi:DNA-binding PadR family transcriptional regulator